MGYTEPKGVLPDFLLKNTINFDDLLERWGLLADYSVGIRELKIMLSESSTTIHRYREPDSNHEKMIGALHVHYSGGARQFDYNAQSNLYVFKEDLIKAEAFLFSELRKEIKTPEKNERITYRPLNFKADTRKFADKGVKDFIKVKGYAPTERELYKYLQSFNHINYIARYSKEKRLLIIEEKEWDYGAFSAFYRENFIIEG